MFQETNVEDIDKIAEALYPSLKQEIVIELDLAAPEGDSTEVHKEPVDKDVMRKLLVTLSGDVACRSVIYGEEVIFDNKGPRGPSCVIDRGEE